MSRKIEGLTVPENEGQGSSASRSYVDPLLRAHEAADVLQISVPTFWRRVADRTVPKPVKLGGLSRWPQSEIRAVIETAKAARAAE